VAVTQAIAVGIQISDILKPLSSIAKSAQMR
jgi:hypothetical protein